LSWNHGKDSGQADRCVKPLAALLVHLNMRDPVWIPEIPFQIEPIPFVENDPFFFKQLLYITFTLLTENIRKTLSSIQSTWESLFPGILSDYFFLDTYFDRFYREEEKVATLVIVFGILAVSIACLGILGLTAHTTQRRTKEIGIRKVIGASAARIAGLLTGEFVKWILFANIIALPAAYYILNKWLAGFAFRTGFSVWFLLIPSAFTLGLAALTVSYHTIGAATANPVDSLRYE
jgi:putative ABC transport system permease protein